MKKLFLALLFGASLGALASTPPPPLPTASECEDEGCSPYVDNEMDVPANWSVNVVWDTPPSEAKGDCECDGDDCDPKAETEGCDAGASFVVTPEGDGTMKAHFLLYDQCRWQTGGVISFYTSDVGNCIQTTNNTWRVSFYSEAECSGTVLGGPGQETYSILCGACVDASCGGNN